MIGRRELARPLLLAGGHVVTMNPAQPEAEAALLADGRIEAVGSLAEVRAAATASGGRDIEELDARGACVVPGLTDSHLHIGSYGLLFEQIDLTDARSLDEVLEQVAAAARSLPSDAWVQGRGWDHTLWPDRRLPDRWALDHICPTQPVALTRKDGHICWVNSAALRRAGIDRSTPSPAGGVIDRDAEEPTGILRETAQDLIVAAVGHPSPDQMQRGLRRAQTHLLGLGITSAHVPETADTLAALQALDQDGDLALRVVYLPPANDLDRLVAGRSRAEWHSDRLRLGPIKCFLDGSLGSHTAAMLEPFTDEPGNRGVLVTPPDALDDLIQRANAAGFAIAMHAIGDRANRMALDAIARTGVSRQHPGLRSRIEHAQLLHPDDIPRLAQLGIVASMQPIHATQDMANADRFWGPRSRGAYAFASLLRAGTVLAFGSDAPVETPDPRAGLYAAVIRQRPDGTPPGGWYPGERISLTEAIRAYTAGAAWAVGLEQDNGSLTPGKVADLTVIEPDIFAAPSDALLTTRIRHTIIGGVIVASDGEARDRA